MALLVILFCVWGGRTRSSHTTTMKSQQPQIGWACICGKGGNKIMAQLKGRRSSRAHVAERRVVCLTFGSRTGFFTPKANQQRYDTTWPIALSCFLLLPPFRSIIFMSFAMDPIPSPPRSVRMAHHPPFNQSSANPVYICTHRPPLVRSRFLSTTARRARPSWSRPRSCARSAGPTRRSGTRCRRPVAAIVGVEGRVCACVCQNESARHVLIINIQSTPTRPVPAARTARAGPS